MKTLDTPKQVQIDDWEGEGGAVDEDVFHRPRTTHRRLATGLERTACKLKFRIRERPLYALAAALVAGLMLGIATRGLPRA